MSGSAYQALGDPEDGLGGGGFGGSSAFSSGLAGTSSRAAEQQQPQDQVKVNKFETSLPMRVDIEAALTYLVGCITGVLFLILEQKNDYVRFHAWQSCLVFFGMLVLHMIFIWQREVSITIMVIDLLLIAYLMFRAYQGAQQTVLVRHELPFVGPLASKWVDSE